MSSKRNTFEAEMVLKVVRYLAQQGYGSENIVVLTPYLGQLLMLRDKLKNETDAILNDLDSNDLSKVGLLSPADTNKKKARIRLATIGKCDTVPGQQICILTMHR